MNLILEVINWAWDHPGEITLNAILLLLLRKFVMKEIQKALHFGRDEEVLWLIKEVEVLTGRKYNGQPDFLKTVQTRYIKSSYIYLRRGIGQAHQLRRETAMLNKKWLVGLIGYIAFFVKQAFGVEVTDELINNLADITLLAIGIIPMVVNMVKKEVKPNDAAKYTGDSGPAV